MPVYRGISVVHVNNGSNVLFWKDLWTGTTFDKRYPRALSYAIKKDISVKDFLSITSLQEAFQLPLSAQAHAEVRQLQADTMETAISNEPDVWTYIWGTKT